MKLVTFSPLPSGAARPGLLLDGARVVDIPAILGAGRRHLPDAGDHPRRESDARAAAGVGEQAARENDGTCRCEAARADSAANKKRLLRGLELPRTFRGRRKKAPGQP